VNYVLYALNREMAIIVIIIYTLLPQPLPPPLRWMSGPPRQRWTTTASTTPHPISYLLGLLAGYAIKVLFMSQGYPACQAACAATCAASTGVTAGGLFVPCYALCQTGCAASCLM
jgi:hypothetical protein